MRYINFSSIFLILLLLIFAFLISFITLNIINLSNVPFLADSKAYIFSDFRATLLSLSLSFLFLITSRSSANIILTDKSEKRVLIYGAGSAGIQLASALKVSKEMQPIAFLDKNPSLHGTYLGGIKVLHPRKLEKLSLGGKVD